MREDARVQAGHTLAVIIAGKPQQMTIETLDLSVVYELSDIMRGVAPPPLSTQYACWQVLPMMVLLLLQPMLSLAPEILVIGCDGGE